MTQIGSDFKTNFSRDVALMLHAHLLSPFHFSNDMSKPPYSALAGVLDLPLGQLQFQLRALHLRSPLMGNQADKDRWQAKFPGRPYELILPLFETHKEMIKMPPGQAQPSFLPKMWIANSYMPKAFKLIPPPPFSLNLVEAVKRQIAFA